MSGHLRQLDPGALLLMYVADELSAADRAEVERMLSSDADLRQQLEEIRGAMESSSEAIAMLDRQDRLMPEASAQRKANRLVRAWTPQKQPRIAASAVKPALTIHWPRLGLAAAALLLLGFAGWQITRYRLANRPSANPVAVNNHRADIQEQPYQIDPLPNDNGGVANAIVHLSPSDGLEMLANSLNLSESEELADMQIAAIVPPADEMDSSLNGVQSENNSAKQQ